MDDDDRRDVPVALRPVAGSGSRRATAVLVAIVATAVALAFLKPWGDLPATLEGEPSARVGPSLAGQATPAPTPDSYADLVVICGSPSGWRAATLQHWVGRESEIRTWTAIDPVPAAAPVDRAIPFAPIASDLVTAIGYCAPRGADPAPADATPRFWALDPDGETARALEPSPLEPAVSNPLGGLWLPPPDVRVALDGADGWRPGRYVLRVDAGSNGRWLGIEIENLAARTPGAPGEGPPPGASASPSGSP